MGWLVKEAVRGCDCCLLVRAMLVLGSFAEKCHNELSFLSEASSD